MIPIQEFNAALMELDFQAAQWYLARYQETCRICIEAPADEGRAPCHLD
jgi:hypothetical protein